MTRTHDSSMRYPFQGKCSRVPLRAGRFFADKVTQTCTNTRVYKHKRVHQLLSVTRLRELQRQAGC